MNLSDFGTAARGTGRDARATDCGGTPQPRWSVAAGLLGCGDLEAIDFRVGTGGRVAEGV